MVRAVGVIGLMMMLLAPVGAQAQTPTVPPPTPGGWTMRPYTSGVAPGHPGADEFTGSFKVTKGSSAVVDLKGASGHTVNNGCNSGVTAKMQGQAPIKHFSKPKLGDDFYWVGTGTELWYTLKFTFQARHSHKVHKGKGKLRLYFPGGVGVFVNPDGTGGFGSLEFTNDTIGFCNLYFDVK
jgi:hypothetical protein